MSNKKKPDQIDIHVAQRIRFRRIMLGHSQEDLGEVLDLSFQQIQKYENGNSRISAGRLLAIANFLRVPVTFFFEERSDDEELPVSINGEPINADFMTNKEAVKLCQAFSRIKDQNVRTNIIRLTNAIADEVELAGDTGRACSAD